MKRKVFYYKRTQHPFFIGDGRPVGFYYSEKDGSPVLKGESSWKKINGVFFNIRSLRVFFSITFRRFWK